MRKAMTEYLSFNDTILYRRRSNASDASNRFSLRSEADSGCGRSYIEDCMSVVNTISHLRHLQR
jgi:hypothetical protein